MIGKPEIGALKLTMYTANGLNELKLDYVEIQSGMLKLKAKVYTNDKF